MKQFLTVLRFELQNFLKNKGYLATTIIISAVLVIGLSVPSFVDISGLLPQAGTEEENSVSNQEESVEESRFAILDESGLIQDIKELNAVFPNTVWTTVDSVADMEKLINDGDVEAGFAVNSSTAYTYYVKNTSFSDNNQTLFNEALSRINRLNYMKENNLDFDEIEALYQTPVHSETMILGKDSVNNYIYTYILLFGLYMMIIIYGQMIAVSVTSEKSNRAIEVLVTSTSTNSLIFGKVIAGALASLLQIVVILFFGGLSYRLNRAAWHGLLDFVFQIPMNVLLTFLVFGILGFVFYSFIFGALGALVSKTEDISSSIGSIVLIFVAVFLGTIFGMTNSSGTLIQVLSYIPFSSCMAMFARVSMGAVSFAEIAISLAILLASIGLVGVLGSKIYRRATLMYGNPVKFSNALKWLKKSDD